MIDHLDEMEKIWYNDIIKEQTDIPRSELLQKQIKDYEIFIKYLNYYISDIQIRLRRLNVMYENELKKVKLLEEKKLIKIENSKKIENLEELEEKILELRKDNLSIAKIAFECGCSTRQVNKYLNKSKEMESKNEEK